MKLITAVVGIGVAGLVIALNLTDPRPARADAIETATKHLTSDQRDLRETTTITRAQANQLGTDVTNPSGKPGVLPAELQDFERSTERLTTLRDRLRQDVEEYKIAYNAQLADFDRERSQITNAATQRTINTVRRHVEDDLNERLQNATGTLDVLDRVLAQGADLQHAAKCVLIADNLHQHGEDLDNQLKDAKTQADAYATTTANLLARINQALED